MNNHQYDFAVRFGRSEDPSIADLNGGTQFRIDNRGFSESICYLSPRAMDLFRVGMAVYSVDRLARRGSRLNSTHRRDISVKIDVRECDFWRQTAVCELVQEIVRFLGGDNWEFRFDSGAPVEAQSMFPIRECPRLCLYSGGLDSAAGLALRVRDCRDSIIAVTARHQAAQSDRVSRQLGAIRSRHGADVQSAIIRTTLRNPPPFSQQESSQRCRSFLFTCLAGAIACEQGVTEIEVFESGIGAMNLPLMHGMLTGARTTRSSHPHFLRRMSDLVSAVAERRIDFTLPFYRMTKAEIVRTLKDDGLEDLAYSTVSCVHYPVRKPGNAKQCGYCAACIGRRQALISAGLNEPQNNYEVDLFSRNSNRVDHDRFEYLKAMLLQVDDLRILAQKLPFQLFECHVRGTRVVAPGEPTGPWIDMLLRYRNEWLELVARGRAEGWRWAKWLGTSSAA